MNEEQIRSFMAQIESMLRDPSALVAIERQIERDVAAEEAAADGWMRHRPGLGLTVVIKVHGGASEIGNRPCPACGR